MKQLYENKNNESYICKFCKTTFNNNILFFKEHVLACSNSRICDVEKENIEYKQKNINLSDKIIDLEGRYASLENKYAALDNEYKSHLINNKNNTYNNYGVNNNNSMSTLNYVIKNLQNAPEFTLINNFDIFDKTNCEYEYEYIDDVLYYYEHDNLADFIGNHIVSVYKKEDIRDQSVLNSDTSRFSYIIRSTMNKNISWIVDKGAKKFIEYAITPLLNVMKDDIRVCIQHINNALKENLDKDEMKRLLHKTLNLQDIITHIDDDTLCQNILKKVTPHFYFNKDMCQSGNLLICDKPNRNINIIEIDDDDNDDDIDDDIEIDTDDDVIEIDDNKIVDKSKEKPKKVSKEITKVVLPNKTTKIIPKIVSKEISKEITKKFYKKSIL